MVAALPLTLLLARTAPIASPVRPFSPVPSATVADLVTLDTPATTSAAEVASTVMPDRLVSRVSRTVVVAPLPTSPPNAVSAGTGAPSRASRALNSRFCDCQPTLLKASVAPTASVAWPVGDLFSAAKLSTLAVTPLTAVARMTASLRDRTAMFPPPSPNPSAYRSLLVTVVEAADRTVLVPTMPPTASDPVAPPLPNGR